MHGCGSIVLPPYGFTTRPVFLRVNCSPFACSFPENIIMHAQRLAFPCVNCCRLRRVDRSIDFKQEENWSAKAGEEDGSRSGVASAVLVLPPAWCLPAARSGLWSPNQSPPSPSLQIPPHVSHIFFCPVSLIASSRAVRLRDAFLFNLWRLEESAAAVPRCERNRDTVQASECPRSCSARTRGHARRGRPRVGRAMGAADVVTHHRWMDGPRG